MDKPKMEKMDMFVLGEVLEYMLEAGAWNTEEAEKFCNLFYKHNYWQVVDVRSEWNGNVTEKFLKEFPDVGKECLFFLGE